MSTPVRGPVLPVYAVEPLPVANPIYVRGPAEPVYFVPGPDGSFIPGSMIDPSTINHNALANLLVGDPHTQYHDDARGDVRYYTQVALDGGQLDGLYYTQVALDGGQLDGLYFPQGDFINISSGATNAGDPAVLDATGKWDVSMIPATGGGTTIINLPIPLDIYLDRNTRFVEQQVHGGLLELVTGQPLNSTPTNIAVTTGIGKLVLVINAGSDVSGTITVTGTTVNRNTGVATPADSVNITVDALTTDTSDTDARGNPRHNLVGAYITSKWFSGAVVISTTNLTLTDVDVYHCSFEQFNDEADITVTTFDINVQATNANAWMYSYLYALEVTGDKCDVTRIASVSKDTAGTADRFFRLRRGSLGIPLVGTTDGIFVEIFFGPANQTYWDDFTCKVWATANQDVSSETVHGSLSGLINDDHLQYFNIDGRAGGQVAYGGTGAADNLTLQATSHVTPGNIFLNGDRVETSGALEAYTLFTLNPAASLSQIWTGSANAAFAFIADRTTATDPAFLFQDAASNVSLAILDNGWLGQGIAAPTHRFHTHEGSSAHNVLHWTNSTTGATATDGLVVGIDVNEKATIWNYEATDLYIGTSNQTRMTISAAGLVGIPTVFGSYKFYVNGTSWFDGTVIVASNLTATGKITAEDMLVQIDSGAPTFQFKDTDDNDTFTLTHSQAADTLILGSNSVAAILTIAKAGNVAFGGTLGGAWTGLSYGTGWVDYGGGYQAGQYKKVGDLVFLRGLVRRTTTSAGDITIGTLPAGYRPAARLMMSTTGYWSSAYQLTRVEILTTGVVQFAGSIGVTVDFFSLDSIVFSIA